MSKEGQPGGHNPFDTMFNLLDGAEKFYKNNQELVDGMLGTGENVSLRDGRILQQADKTDDEVVITAETEAEDMSEISTSYFPDDATMVIRMGGRPLKVELPYDVVMSEAKGELKNGVLTVTIPRDGDYQGDGWELEETEEEEDEE